MQFNHTNELSLKKKKEKNDKFIHIRVLTSVFSFKYQNTKYSSLNAGVGGMTMSCQSQDTQDLILLQNDALS